MRFELRAQAAEFVGVLLPIIDFAVVAEPDAAIIVTKGLIGFRARIHDGESRVDQGNLERNFGCHIRIRIGSLALPIPADHMFGIGPAPSQGRQHGFQRRWRQRLLSDDAGDAAHG